jgi:hypothetical protein
MSVSAPNMSTCGKCGATMDASRAIYDKTGTLLCPACSATSQIAEGDARAVSSTVGSAVGIILGGILSVTCINPLGLVSVVTLISGVSWLLMVARIPTHRAKMGGKFVPCLIAVIFGMGCAAILPAAFLLGMLAVALKH